MITGFAQTVALTDLVITGHQMRTSSGGARTRDGRLGTLAPPAITSPQKIRLSCSSEPRPRDVLPA